MKTKISQENGKKGGRPRIIDYSAAKHDGETLYRYHRPDWLRPETVVIMPTGYIRLIDIAASDMPVLKNIPDGTKSGTWELN